MRRLVVFLRVIAGLSLLKGLYHWALVLAVGLWLAAAWGGVVWLTAAISMAAIEMLFPQVYGGRLWIAIAEVVAILVYSFLTLKACNERPD